MCGRQKNAFPHRVAVHNIDPRFDADEVGVQIADGARNEWIQMALAPESQIGDINTGGLGCDDGPRPGGDIGFHAVAGRAACT